MSPIEARGSIETLKSRIAVWQMIPPLDDEDAKTCKKLIDSDARRVLVNSARHIVGGYYAGSPEDRAVEMLLRLAQEIPL